MSWQRVATGQMNFPVPLLLRFFTSVCENTEDVAGAGELVFDVTDTETRSPNHGQ